VLWRERIEAEAKQRQKALGKAHGKEGGRGKRKKP
jgi:hypothetical protein